MPHRYPVSHSTHSSHQNLTPSSSPLLRLGYHTNHVIGFAADDETPTMSILMETTVRDFFVAIKTSRFTFGRVCKYLMH